MALSPKLALRQSTALIMTPQLQQAIKLLQLSNQDLAEFVDAEIAQNPLLERESDEGGMEAAEPAGADEGMGEEGMGEAWESDADLAADAGERAEDGFDGDDEPGVADTADLTGADAPARGANDDQPLDTEFDNVWTNDDRRDIEDAPPPQFSDWGTGGGAFDGEGLDLEERLSGTETLREHLMNQINFELVDPRDRLIAAALVDSLDEAGYLASPLAEIAERLGVEEADAGRVLAVAQNLDPTGVFARDLAECLRLQLEDRNRLDPAMDMLLKNLEYLARRDISGLKRLCGVDDEDLADMVAEIRALDPKPGLAFGDNLAQTLIPDIILRPKPDGGWHVELNPDTLPRVLVNRTYYAEVRKAARSKRDRDYVNDCMHSANWLVKALHQRATTILKVATEIVRIQEPFFTQGVRGLKPLTLREIADIIGMHESTVSRVTTNKFMATPRGVFELKYFFTQAIASSSGGAAHSATAVRQRIKELIDAERPKSILSDDRIVEILSSEGIEIARRTVAKYRESMRIPSSVQRRREKAVSL